MRYTFIQLNKYITPYFLICLFVFYNHNKSWGVFSIRKYHPLRVHVHSTKLYSHNQIIFETSVHFATSLPNRIDSIHVGASKIMSEINVITYNLRGIYIKYYI